MVSSRSVCCCESSWSAATWSQAPLVASRRRQPQPQPLCLSSPSPVHRRRLCRWPQRRRSPRMRTSIRHCGCGCGCSGAASDGLVWFGLVSFARGVAVLRCAAAVPLRSAVTARLQTDWGKRVEKRIRREFEEKQRTRPPHQRGAAPLRSSLRSSSCGVAHDSHTHSTCHGGSSADDPTTPNRDGHHRPTRPLPVQPGPSHRTAPHRCMCHTTRRRRR